MHQQLVQVQQQIIALCSSGASKKHVSMAHSEYYIDFRSKFEQNRI